MRPLKFLSVFALFRLVYTTRPIVELEFGTVLGQVKEFEGRLINRFLGLPYATPPVKELRFKKPTPFQGTWRTPYDAGQWPNICPQLFIEFPSSHALGNQSEDCLYLNIWTPHPLNEINCENLTPVLVFMHNGGFLSGGSSFVDLDGLELTARADVVLVTLNYRLGPLGFLHAHDQEAPGNAGLWDQLVALEWVKDHIRNFGGDPDQITISGQSSGGMSAVMHILSPYGRDLYSKAIVMSGPTVDQFPVTSKPYALIKASRLATVVGCKKSSFDLIFTKDELRCMRQVDYKVLVESQYDPTVKVESGYYNMWPFRPIYGDLFSPVSPVEGMRSERSKSGLQILVGTLTNDGCSLSVLFKKSASNGTQLTGQPEYLALLTLYYNDGSNEAQELVNTVSYVCPTNFFAENMYRKNEVFQYDFAYPATATILCSNNKYRPCHGDEVTILFGNLLTDPNDKAANRAWIEFISTFVKGDEMPVAKYTEKNGRVVAPYYKFNGPNNRQVKFGNHHHDCIVWNAGIDAGKETCPVRHVR